MEITFVGKRALVTGAGKGIGRGIALALAKGGAITHCISRTQSDLDSLKKEHENIRTIYHDVSDWDTTKKVVSEIGPIDLLVNNAGITTFKPIGEITSDEFDNIININLKAAINIAQVVSQGMKERKSGGAIVNVSSMIAKRAAPNYSLYCISKAGLDMATKSMAFELGPHQIRVNSVNPGTTRTDMLAAASDDIVKPIVARIPQNRIAEIDEVVHAVLYLLSDKADMINGVTLPVDGGFLTH